MKKHVLLITCVACIAAIICMIFALTRKTAIRSEFVPPAFEVQTESGTPEVADDLGYTELDAKAFKVSICGNLILDQDKVEIDLTNPESNTVWLKVRMLNENNDILGETGLVKPGNYVTSLILKDIPKQSQTIKLKIMAYEPEMYYSAGAINLNTTLVIE